MRNNKAISWSKDKQKRIKRKMIGTFLFPKLQSVCMHRLVHCMLQCQTTHALCRMIPIGEVSVWMKCSHAKLLLIRSFVVISDLSETSFSRRISRGKIFCVIVMFDDVFWLFVMDSRWMFWTSAKHHTWIISRPLAAGVFTHSTWRVSHASRGQSASKYDK